MYQNKLILGVVVSLLLSGCSATESSRALETKKVKAFNSVYSGEKSKLSVGKFQNQSSFQNGIFSSGDRLGSQAKTILLTHLQQSNRFSVLERTNLSEISQEADFSGVEQNITGAKYVVTGALSEFGRKQEGDRQLFGLLGKGKSQVAYAKVNLNVIDVTTSEVVYSVQGAGEYSLSTREVIGFGSTASYDSTLNGKILDLAIREAVDNLVVSVDSGKWRPN
ncbi:lipoprotein [Pseudoalteromonas sp. A25]|uniref:CsgG/HfaB family protein n=1 Tax=Pseudoalteromonas sp. A25 TaxID=116092 RepID=UPI001260FAD1|nr:CsgG/HfaB family protein [Pseudoalteromonas sp. A25]BBN83117.1 lipoprotein [Pseudoalteromonas sp. A25]